MTLSSNRLTIFSSSYNTIFVSLPGVEFLQTGVQVLESLNQKSPSINADVSVAGVPGVQQEQGVDVSTVFQGSDQSRVIMQTQSFAEPVNGVVAHGCRSPHR